ncbi:hypothetical protein [Streptosporangium sp. H16]|uniref:hypothetical protein n=1 Tax=Streptosporangium sp. H16 TaxID=3444184 RepID=UPI003F79F61B
MINDSPIGEQTYASSGAQEAAEGAGGLAGGVGGGVGGGGHVDEDACALTHSFTFTHTS